MKTIILRLIIILIMLVTGSALSANENLMIFCGAAFKKPVEELINVFKKKTGINVNANYAGIGVVYSQLLFSRKGDIFIVPSPDLMEKAKSNKIVLPDTIKSFAYIVPVINVLKGNPKNITGLEDLTRPGIRIALGNPRTVFIGMLAVEIIESGLDNEKKELLRKNIVAYADSFSKLSTFLLLRQVDVIIGFHYLADWFPGKIEAIKLKPDEIHRTGCGKAAVISFSNQVRKARMFIDFIASDDGQKIFKQYHYFSSKKDADAYIGKPKPVGGIYSIPHEWTN